MKIAIMLRHLDDHEGGVMEYTKRLLGEFFAKFTQHDYLLLYRNSSHLGFFGTFENVQEVVAEAPAKIVWDQFAVPRVLKKERPDILFNPKYSLPLFTSCPGVFVCHGLDWYVMPWGSKWMDRLSHKYLIPRYSHKAAKIVSVSDTTTDHIVKYLNADRSQVATVYHGVDESFGEPVTDAVRQAARSKYNLPESFYLYVSRIYPPKNFGAIVRAFAKTGPQDGRYLVVAGTHTEGCEDEIALIKELGIEQWVLQLGWVGRDDLPGLYALADALVQPSLYESFGISLLEAMSIGCPVLTANRFGAAEIVGNAGLLVDPDDTDDIAAGMQRIVTDETLRSELKERGFERSRIFTWEACAEQTMKLLEEVHRQQH